jgi:hypothetical protein
MNYPCLFLLASVFSMPTHTNSSPTVVHFESHNASTAVAVGDNHLLLAEDELNVIRLYARHQSGPALYQVDLSSWLQLEGKEVDTEASCSSSRFPGRIYWIGSMSNNKKGKIRPDRDRIFATDLQGQEEHTTLKFVGFYQGLRSHLLDWGDRHGYQLSAKAAKGIEPKRADGFNVEGMEMAPDQSTLYIALRAPLVGKQQNRALIVPILNFEDWFAQGKPTAPPRLASPIELDLGGRGIRSLSKNNLNEYLIVAGSVDSIAHFALYRWDGLPSSAPVLLTAELGDLAPEGIVEVPTPLKSPGKVQLLSDFGTERASQSTWLEF